MRPGFVMAGRGPTPQQMDSEGRPIGAAHELKLRDFYAYIADLTFTAVNQRAPASITIQADSDFVLVKLMSTSSDTPLDNQGGALLQITDNGSGRNIFDAQLPLAAITGSGKEPFILPWVHVFPRKGSITLDLTNTGTNTNRVRIVLAGYKIIPQSRL